MSQETMPDQTMPAKESVWSRIRNHDLTYQFLRSPVTVTAAVICLVLIVSAMCAPWLATMNPFDPKQVLLMDANIPPVWIEGGDPRFVFFMGCGSRWRLVPVVWR